MEDSSSHSFNKTHFQDPNPVSFSSAVPTKPPMSKFLFIRYFFSKSLITILVLLVFYYFPSQAPEFFKKTTLTTNLWELIYLLVIGIAVCYGLFSKKVDTVHSCDDNIGTKETYLSGISHISSIFEHGVHDFNRFDENKLFEESMGSGSKLSKFGNRFEKSNGQKVNRYFFEESMVVINDKKYVLEQLGEPKTIKQNLGSKSFDSGVGNSVVNDSSSGWDGIKKQKFRGLVPIKLEEKFKKPGSDSNSNSDSDSNSDSRIPVDPRSKFIRLGKRDDDYRHVSVGNLDLEHLKSKSLQSQMNNFSENEESEGIETNLNVETSFMESKSRSDMNDHVNSKEIIKDFGKFKVDDGTLDPNKNGPFRKSKSQRSSDMNLEYLSGEEEFSNNIIKPSPIANTYKMGKSVRTNRPREQVVEAKVNATILSQTEKVNATILSQTDDKIEANVKTDELSETEMHSGEVDRKAEEFIAKFREQIRLQKVASARKLNFGNLI